MKPILTVSFILFILIGIAWVGVSEMNDRNRVQQAEIDGLKRENQIQADSLNKALLLTHDSLEVAIYTIRYLNGNTTKDKATVKIKTESHEKIVFVNLNDSTRHRKLSNLYPSYVYPR